MRVEEVQILQRDALVLAQRGANISSANSVVLAAVRIGSIDNVCGDGSFRVGWWCRCGRHSGYVARETDADLVSYQELEVVTAPVDVDIPGHQLGNSERAIIRAHNAEACIVLLHGVYFTGVRHAELGAGPWEICASSFETVEIEKIAC